MPLYGDGRSGTFSTTVTQYGGYKTEATPSSPPPVAATRLVTQRRASMDSLVDDYSAVDTTKANYGAAASVTGGQLVLTPNTSYTGFVDYNQEARDLTGAAAVVELVQSTNVGNGGVETYVSLYADNPNSNAALFDVAGGQLKFIYRVAGVTAGSNAAAPITYNATDHRWLRLRESAGLILWDTSPDRTTWINQASWTPAWPVTALFLAVGNGYAGTEPAPGATIFDNLNVAPSTPSAGTGAGTWTFTGTATGTRSPKAVGAGNWSFTGTAAGARTPKGSGAGTWTFAGTAAGKRTPKATANGSWSFTGTATGSRTPKAAGTGSWAFTGAATAATARRGTGSGLLTWAGTAGAVTAHRGAGTGAWAFTGAAAGLTPHRGTATGLLAWAGEAAGFAPTVGLSEGFGIGSWQFTGAAAGRSTRSGTGTGAWAFLGFATAGSGRAGAGLGTWAWNGAATGSAPVVEQRSGSGTGLLAWAGVATGGQPSDAIAAPSETLVVPAEQRVQVILADVTRVLEVAADARAAPVRFDPRSLTVPVGDRELAVV